MSLRTKLALLLTAVMAAYGISASLVLYIALGSRFVAFEREESEKDVRRVIDLLGDQVVRMSDYGWEYSSWDATYNFVDQPNDEYLINDLGVNEPGNIGYHLYFVIDKEGRVVWHCAFDDKFEEQLTFAEFPTDRWPIDHPLLQHDTVDSEISGLLATEHGILNLSSRPICRTGNVGPINGTLVMAAFLRPADLDHLAQQLQIPFELRVVKKPLDLPAETIRVAATTNNSRLFQTGLDDIYGRHQFLLTVTTSREISTWGYSIVRWAIIFLLGATALALATLGFLLTRLVVRPLIGLTDHVTTIARSEDLGAPLRPRRNDEIGLLAREFNLMAQRIQEHDLRREEAEFAVRDSEARLRAIFDAAPDGIILVDDAMRVDSANPAACRMFGWSQQGIAGKDANELFDGLQGDVRAGFQVAPQPGSQDQTEVMGREAIGRRRDGGVFPIHVALSRVQFAHGVHNLAIVRDITELRQIHEEMARTQHMAALGEMGTTVAHEVRNPIAGIGGVVQVLRQKLTPGDPAAELLDEILNNVQRVENTVRSLLLFARRWHANLQDVYVNQIVDDACRTVTHDPRYPSCTMEVSVPPGIQVRADAQLIGQVLANLLGNAVEAAQTGGHIRISTEEIAGAVRILIDDNGPGIPPELRATVFRPFYTTKTQGTGLGLGICKQMIDAQGGAIEIESSPLGGARVAVRLSGVAAMRRVAVGH